MNTRPVSLSSSCWQNLARWAALCLRVVGAENVDIQFRQCAAELGRVVAARGVLGIHPKDAVLVAVERDRGLPCVSR
jgi:hypothetical protein